MKLAAVSAVYHYNTVEPILLNRATDKLSYIQLICVSDVNFV